MTVSGSIRSSSIRSCQVDRIRVSRKNRPCAAPGPMFPLLSQRQNEVPSTRVTVPSPRGAASASNTHTSVTSPPSLPPHGPGQPSNGSPTIGTHPAGSHDVPRRTVISTLSGLRAGWRSTAACHRPRRWAGSGTSSDRTGGRCIRGKPHACVRGYVSDSTNVCSPTFLSFLLFLIRRVVFFAYVSVVCFFFFCSLAGAVVFFFFSSSLSIRFVLLVADGVPAFLIS